ncbi:MAG TPA: cupredoxin family copper-binding protein [Solirubrobacterales bacterium]|nr:cupredoxin family copper-binding protein [Solirubrobacterales bacterium]
MRPTVITLVMAALVITGCGGGGDTDSTPSGSPPSPATTSASGPQAVAIADFTYEPAQLTVPAGTTVEFTNEDSTPHTATSKESGAFETGSIEKGKTGTVTLDKPGTYAYYCAFHPFMKGTITVE